MKFISIKEASVNWGVSEQMVRRYCKKGGIPGAVQKNGVWRIPAKAAKPALHADTPELSSLAKQIIYQKRKNNHFGIYEYIQVNLAYSSCRMASNRLTRTQVLEAYRTNKISVAFEPMKIDDLIEVANHFMCLRYVIDSLSSPLYPAFIKKLHYILFYGTYAERKDQNRPGEFRRNGCNIGVPAEKVVSELGKLLTAYEKLRNVDFEKILDLHVRFEQIHPFDDGNGRVGRVLIMKECLRHGLDPFIIDDKRRSQYNQGIARWDAEPQILRDVCLEAQARFQAQMELCRLMQYCRAPKG